MPRLQRRSANDAPRRATACVSKWWKKASRRDWSARLPRGHRKTITFVAALRHTGMKALSCWSAPKGLPLWFGSPLAA